MTTCSINDQHRYGSHLATCPWCERRLRLAGRDPFPPREVVLRGDYVPAEKTASLKTHTYVLPIAHKARPHTRANQPGSGFGRRALIWSGIVVALVLCGVGLFAMVTGQSRRHEARASAETARVQLGVLVKEEAQFQSGAIREESAEATLLELKKMGEAAMQHVQRGLALDAQSPEALAARAETEAALRRVEADYEAQAARVLLNAVQNANAVPPDETTRRQQIAAALKHCQTALSLDPHNRPTWIQRIRALGLAGDTAAEQAALQQARILFPDDPTLK